VREGKTDWVHQGDLERGRGAKVKKNGKVVQKRPTSLKKRERKVGRVMDNTKYGLGKGSKDQTKGAATRDGPRILWDRGGEVNDGGSRPQLGYERSYNELKQGMTE